MLIISKRSYIFLLILALSAVLFAFVEYLTFDIIEKKLILDTFLFFVFGLSILALSVALDGIKCCKRKISAEKKAFTDLDIKYAKAMINHNSFTVDDIIDPPIGNSPDQE